MKDLAQEITNQIIEMIEAGQADGNWVMPWHKIGGHAPHNAVTGRHYAGVNILLLWAAKAKAGYNSPAWATFKAWNSAGYKLNNAKGQGVPIVFWSQVKKTDKATGEESFFPILKQFYVFNADLVTDKAGEPYAAGDGEPIVDDVAGFVACDDVIAGTGAAIEYGHDRACYIPKHDQIIMPALSQFEKAAAYYSTAFHELAHWTGSKSRLSRDLSGRFGSEAYAVEELVAELSAAFTCGHVGLIPETRPDHARYIKSWLKVLKDDKRAILKASTLAAQASNYILGIEPRAAA